MLKAFIVSLWVDVITLPLLIERLRSWTQDLEGRSVCLSNVHMCMEAFDDPAFQEAVNESDVVLPDSRIVFFAQRLLGFRSGDQIRGTDLTLSLCELSSRYGFRIGFYGGSERTLALLESNLLQRFQNLNIVFSESPPFRSLSLAEDQYYIDCINQSNIDFLFVGLGCPKQEKWMSLHRSKLSCTMFGVGAAFDFISGEKSAAPLFMQKFGLEWLYRFSCEPRRLFARYFWNNPRFILYFCRQLISG